MPRNKKAKGGKKSASGNKDPNNISTGTSSQREESEILQSPETQEEERNSLRTSEFSSELQKMNEEFHRTNAYLGENLNKLSKEKLVQIMRLVMEKFQSAIGRITTVQALIEENSTAAQDMYQRNFEELEKAANAARQSEERMKNTAQSLNELLKEERERLSQNKAEIQELKMKNGEIVRALKLQNSTLEKKVRCLENQLKKSTTTISPLQTLQESAQREATIKNDLMMKHAEEIKSKNEKIVKLKKDLEKALEPVKSLNLVEQELKKMEDKWKKSSEKCARVFSEKEASQKLESEAKKEVASLKEKLKRIKMDHEESEKEREGIERINKQLDSKLKVVESALRAQEKLQQQDKSEAVNAELRASLNAEKDKSQKLEYEVAETKKMLLSFEISLEQKDQGISMLNSELAVQHENFRRAEERLVEMKTHFIAEQEKNRELELSASQLQHENEVLKNSNLRLSSNNLSYSQEDNSSNHQEIHLETFNKLLVDQNKQQQIIESLIEQLSKADRQYEPKSGLEERVQKLEAESLETKFHLEMLDSRLSRSTLPSTSAVFPSYQPFGLESSSQWKQ